MKRVMLGFVLAFLLTTKASFAFTSVDLFPGIYGYPLFNENEALGELSWHVANGEADIWANFDVNAINSKGWFSENSFGVRNFFLNPQIAYSDITISPANNWQSTNMDDWSFGRITDTPLFDPVLHIKMTGLPLDSSDEDLFAPNWLYQEVYNRDINFLVGLTNFSNEKVLYLWNPPTIPSGGSSYPVPEPATMFLFGTGLLGTLFRKTKVGTR